MRPLAMPRGPVAVIDIGSNSGRVVVYSLRRGGPTHILASSRASLRLVRELDENGSLSSRAIQRAIDALRDFRAIARGAGARQVIAVATAAVRDARNGAAFIRRIRRELGLSVRILTGREEANYGFLGAVRGLPVSDGTLFDVGGGSMQVSLFRKRRLGKAFSFPLGALRLSDAFLHSDPPREQETERLRRHVARHIDAARLRRLKSGDTLVGTGGTLRNLAKIDSRQTPYPIARLHGYVLLRRRLASVLDLLAAQRQKRRAQVSGLNDDRADSIVGGGLAILTLMERLGASAVQVSGQGVREGLAVGLVSSTLPPARSVREASIQALAESFREWNPAAAERRESLALTLARRVHPGASDRLREALGHAARLLDIGRSIDFFDRHEHVASIVLQTDLLGFSHREIALISAVVASAGDEGVDLARYEPLLHEDDIEEIERAAVLLVLADDITERCAPPARIRVTCRVRKKEARIFVRGLAGWRPRRIGPRFQKAFGRRLLVEPGRAS
jgi:exopolyphosphatase / guanosine-5'-triphosphate,3'-diphosphate pyrophosphatase